MEQKSLFGEKIKEEKEKPKISRSRNKKKDLPLIETPYVIEPHLLKCKELVEKLCKEHNETAFIFFSSSKPYDDEVVVKLDSHKFCSYRAGCVSFRFEKGRLVAYDSNFDGGTSSIDTYYKNRNKSQEQIIIWEKELIKKTMEKVFSRKCEESSFTEKDNGESVKDFEIGEDFWEIDEWTINSRLEDNKITDRKKIAELHDTLREFKEKKANEEAEFKRKRDLTIEDDFIFRADLNDWLFKEDEFGRYRERIIDRVEKFGVMNWFKKIGYPVNPEAIYKNKYTGDETTIKKEIYDCYWKPDENFEIVFEDNAFYLWESWLPLEKWNDKELMSEYKEGTPEYIKKKDEEEKERRKMRNKLDKESKIAGQSKLIQMKGGN